MSTTVLIDLVVGEPIGPAGTGRRSVSLAEAATIAGAAERAGVAALRLVDGTPGVRTLDPTVVAGYLAGRSTALGYLVDVPTDHQAPFNVARRVSSLDRATGGRVGLVLRPGDGDEVSDAAAPDPSATDRSERWAEYAGILTRLWDSFPREALIGDQDGAVVADDTLIRPIGHEGRFYRVAGPLDGPTSPQGRPVLVAAHEDLSLAAVATTADVVVVDATLDADADARLTAAVHAVGRARSAVALVGRGVVTRADLADGSTADRWAGMLARHRWDGLLLAPTGGADEILRLLTDVVPLLGPERRGALRSTLGVRETAGVSA